jgi:hypothetical protein
MLGGGGTWRYMLRRRAWWGEVEWFEGVYTSPSLVCLSEVTSGTAGGTGFGDT